MGFKIAEAFVEIKGDKGKFSKTIRGAKRETAGFAKSATKNLKMIGIGLTAIGVAAAAAATIIAVKLTQAIIRAGTSVVKTAIKYDKLRIGLIAVTGSAKEAGIQLNRLRILAESPGLGFEQAIQGSISLQAAGLSAALAEKSLSAFGNALAVVGKGAVELGRVNVQLAQIAAKTSGFGADIRVLKEAIPAIGPVLRKAFDGKPLEDVTITGKELIEVLVTGLNELGRAGDSVGNNINNLKTSFDLLKKSLGDKLLKATSDVAKGLSGIVDKLTVVIENYEDYRDDAAQVFRELGVIGIKLTGAMIGGMAKIVGRIAKIVWVPLKFEILKTFQDINDAVEIGMIKMMGKIREFFGGDGEIARLQIATVKTSRAVWDAWFKTIRNADVDTAIREGLKSIEADFASTFAAVMKAIADADKVLSKFGENIPETISESVKKGIAELKKIAPGELDFLTLKAEDPRKAVQRQVEAAQRIFDFRSALDTEMSERQRRFTDNFRDGLRRQEEAAQRMVNTIAPAFENMFTSLFSGNTKNLWQKFWVDLKNIAIRQMATIFATQLITGLLTGGTSFAAAGAGSLLAGLAPRSIDPTSRAIGGVARAAGAIGNFLEGGTIIIQDQDLGNFDVQRLTKQVEQGIAPALAEASADGIQ